MRQHGARYEVRSAVKLFVWRSPMKAIPAAAR